MYKRDINKEITYIPREKCFVFLLTHKCPPHYDNLHDYEEHSL